MSSVCSSSSTQQSILTLPMRTTHRPCAPPLPSPFSSARLHTAHGAPSLAPSPSLTASAPCTFSTLTSSVARPDPASTCPAKARKRLQDNASLSRAWNLNLKHALASKHVYGRLRGSLRSAQHCVAFSVAGTSISAPTSKLPPRLSGRCCSTTPPLCPPCQHQHSADALITLLHKKGSWVALVVQDNSGYNTLLQSLFPRPTRWGFMARCPFPSWARSSARVKLPFDEAAHLQVLLVSAREFVIARAIVQWLRSKRKDGVVCRVAVLRLSSTVAMSSCTAEFRPHSPFCKNTANSGV